MIRVQAKIFIGEVFIMKLGCRVENIGSRFFIEEEVLTFCTEESNSQVPRRTILGSSQRSIEIKVQMKASQKHRVMRGVLF